MLPALSFSSMEDYDVLHLTRTTLLDRILGDFPLSPRRQIVSRVMYAAKTVIKETSKQHLSSYHTELIQKVVGRIDKVTGFLLVYPTCCLHVLEVTYRFFPSWVTGYINASNLGPYEPKNEELLLSEISNLNINVLKWGKTLSEMDKTQQAQALDSVRSSAEEFLPDDPAAIFTFILADGTPKLQEFLEIYDLPPQDIIFENDLVWPMPGEPFTWT